MVDIAHVDAQIRAGHRYLGRKAKEQGKVLAGQCPRTLAAALYGGARTRQLDTDAQELAARGWSGVPFGVARAWRALLLLADDYGEPTGALQELANARGGRYQNQPAWVLGAVLEGAGEVLR